MPELVINHFIFKQPVIPGVNWKIQIRPSDAIFQSANVVSEETAKNVFQITFGSVPSAKIIVFQTYFFADGLFTCLSVPRLKPGVIQI